MVITYKMPLIHSINVNNCWCERIFLGVALDSVLSVTKYSDSLQVATKMKCSCSLFLFFHRGPLS